MPTFKTIHTLYGLQRLAAAEASGTPINLPTMAVGDGNGNPVEPGELQAVLVRERYRAAVNRVYQDPDTPTKFFCEMVIPAATGGFTLREFGVFDDAGGLFVVGNLPDMYKPTPADGAFSDTILRVEFSAQNATLITLQIDPNVAVASQSWVINNITMQSLIPGGTTGQLLRKTSNADGDMEWGSPDDVTITVDTIEEAQTLAADQLVVDLVATTTRGLALYIDGNRLRRDQWTADPVIVTRLSLAVSYAAGTRLICSQNEPTGSAPAPLERSLNLSDVPNPATARANLGVYNKEESDRAGQPGHINYTARSTAPPGWLKANGAGISRTAYAALFAAIGTTFGVGDGFNTFNLPDLRGEFIRGWDDGRGVDGSRSLGSSQAGETASHGHTGSTSAAGIHAHGVNDPGHSHQVTQEGGRNTSLAYQNGPNSAFRGEVSTLLETTRNATGIGISENGNHSHTVTISATGGSETRPRNLALLAVIKF
ncbi:phage tail-collar fiber domain-containing protein [Polaromonas naphthalenivorans]|uniref:Phage Tail Collar domain protein n=1 Tax=Polaromonas naphthalenivorans (strain CJ2) TaxID=365044 RepID=A1VSH6_POLNA|nr:phage tail protein [Polaromonas naphthalenivorans]ABM38604.1 phage Tail Collar domain protein [Polaromonas naphthalenivorans CJ2]